ncbi:uncharacterized conserved protein [Lichtheimia corymbifera JMRC:FSU:9682]|uniref:Autophagy-related protein 13 n=1 Tax=Lichtheimia corymbifera JMRC:FSU:9682 TaxID=1263082 RepID=A0A068RQL5_9FUNG|nr:uncharacterized conserved protein [Lichtheimia corymbifera JMRC:FSU:9682]
MPVLVSSDQPIGSSCTSDALTKLIQIIVRSRLGTHYVCGQDHAPGDLCCFALCYQGESFSLILNTQQKNGSLLERWILSVDSSSSSSIRHDNNETTSGMMIRMKQQQDKKENGSHDMILLLQAVYSYTRMMPVHTMVTNNTMSKSELAITMRHSAAGLSCFSHSPSPVEFSHDAHLQTHHFQPTFLSSIGTVSLEVVYAEKPTTTTEPVVVTMRRLSRLSLSAMDMSEEDTNNTSPTNNNSNNPLSSMPIPTSRMQYTRRSSIAYSTSPSSSSLRGVSISSNSNKNTTGSFMFAAHSNNSINSHFITTSNNSNPRRRCSLGGAESFVGSYEESLLSGRMSTVPSKPIVFQAQIGVLGHGDCTPKCPPHRTILFPAFFYESDASLPSPYVGTVELTKRYRVPAKGQLQIVIKNPNKTAVKLFLIPYDVLNMPPNTKTFLRQKSYASGLRYAIHLQLCRTEKKRVYLYKHFRVVFANRISDARETLKVTCEGPFDYVPLTQADREFLS